jgi:hypothetical protein
MVFVLSLYPCIYLLAVVVAIMESQGWKHFPYISNNHF